MTERTGKPPPPAERLGAAAELGSAAGFGAAAELGSAARAVVAELVAAHPALAECGPAIEAGAATIVATFRAGGRLYLCGNGGSHADAQHIAGELVKSYARARPLDPAVAAKLGAQPRGAELSRHLHAGLPAAALGTNTALASAIANDIALPHAGFAQELLALGTSGDALLAISTTGRSANVLLAASVARALGVCVVALTGASGGELGALAGVAIRAPATVTSEVQEWHVRIYHCVCSMIEVEIYGEG